MTKDETAKLIDFGSAIELNNATECNNESDLRGTSLYLAPECWNGKYSPASDMWAVGVLLCFMLFFTAPFNAATRAELKDKILATASTEGGIERVLNKLYGRRFVSDECKDLLLHIFEVNPERRLTACQALEHGWVKKYSVAGIVA